MIKLSKRLSACAELVGGGARLADIGCDHGYVPVFLVQSGKIRSAVACDINEGPLSSCRALVKEQGLENKIQCVLSNGFEKIDNNAFDDVLIAGMGGELIAKILSDCSCISKKHLVLNPMSHSELVRKWLYDNGFSINNDLIIKDGSHYYNVLDASFCNRKTEYDNSRLFLGEINDFSNRQYFIHLLNYLENKQKGGINYNDVILKIKECLNDNS